MGGGAKMPVSFRIAITGDVMLGRLVNQEIARSGFVRPWGDMLSEFQAADLRLINLECALTSRTERWAGDPYKPFFFRSEPGNVETLRVAGIDFACLSNNHICDFRTEGLLDTVETLDGAGIKHAGAGKDLSAAAMPAQLTVNGYRVAVLAYSDHPVVWAASLGQPGLNLCRPDVALKEKFQRIEDAIKSVRDECDFLIFTIHWGPNMRVRPTVSFKEFARVVIDCGADVFWGHSSHVVQGIEFHNGKPILYDTGDFLDDYAVDYDLRNDLTALFMLGVSPPKVTSLDLIPARIRKFQVNHVRGDDREWFARRVSQLCGEMGTIAIDRGDRISIEMSK
jgi:poly-gamma-glutamate capsule biosynthesis protein CapA/YwtB (metallophosphatase superfamily)